MQTLLHSFSRTKKAISHDKAASEATNAKKKICSILSSSEGPENLFLAAVLKAAANYKVHYKVPSQELSVQCQNNNNTKQNYRLFPHLLSHKLTFLFACAI